GTPSSGPLPTITANPALQGSLGGSYSLSLGTGSSSTYSLPAGTLPVGLALTASGQLVGTPLSPGSYAFTILLTDARGNQASQAFTMTVGTSGTKPVWKLIGPPPLIATVAANTPQSENAGRVSSVAIDPADATHWLVGVGNGGIWESRDGGS